MVAGGVEFDGGVPLGRVRVVSELVRHLLDLQRSWDCRGTRSCWRRVTDIREGFESPAAQVQSVGQVLSSARTVIERLAWTINGERILLSTPRNQDMHDPADHAAIINSRLAPCIGRKRRSEPVEMLVAERDIVPIHQPSPFGDRESRFARDGDLVYGSQP
jgi:hypothetical protein